MNSADQAKPGSGSAKKPTEQNRPGLGKLFVGLSLVLLIISAMLGLAALYIHDQYLPEKFAQNGPATAEVKITIYPGSGVNSIAKQLANDGLIKHEFWFRIKGYLSYETPSLKAGEYKIQAAASIDQIFEQLQQGRVVQHGITIAEGLTVRAVLRQIQASDLLQGEIKQVPAEGSLLPETWYVVRGTNRQDLIDRMQAAQAKTLADLWQTRSANLPLSTPQQALILASIVEKETGVSAERERVAAVFINRLRKGMRLESDPTIIYGLTGGEPLGRGLRRSEIDKKTPWNTYRINGLPLTPISNPGAASIRATLHPASTNEYFFVADGTGGHAFARTYAGHLVNVAKWRKVERQRRRAARSQTQ